MNKKLNWILLILMTLDILLLKFLPWLFDRMTILNYPTRNVIMTIGILLFVGLFIIVLIQTIKTIRKKRYDKFKITTLIIGWVFLLTFGFTDSNSNWIEPFKSKIIYQGNSDFLIRTRTPSKGIFGFESITSFGIKLREDKTFEYQNNIPTLKQHKGTFQINSDTISLIFNEEVLNSGDFIIFNNKGLTMILSNKSTYSENYFPDTINFIGNTENLIRYIGDLIE